MLLFKSPKEPTGNTLPTFFAIVLATLAMCGAAFKPIDTVPNAPTFAMAGSMYAGASNGTTFRAIDRYGMPLSTCLAKSPICGQAFIPNMKDLYWLIMGKAFQSEGTFRTYHRTNCSLY